MTEQPEPAAEEYERPDWEQAKHAAQAQAAADDIRLVLRHVEQREGRVEPVDLDAAICARRYRLPA